MQPDQPDLFEPGEYLDARSEGYFSVLAKPHGQARQDSYPLRLLPTVVEHADRSVDTWITQASFTGPNRRAVNVLDVGVMFADLDTYHCPGLRDRPPEEQANLLAAFCAEEGIPAPSIVLFSGRGLQAKWLLSEALGRVSLPEWNRTQLSLVKLLEPFAADRNARDISRVLRLDRTTNTKSGERCRVVYTSSGTSDCLARYDFAELSEELPQRFPEPEPQPRRQSFNTNPKVLSNPTWKIQRLNWTRLEDLRLLWRLRGGVPVGYREITLFWELNFMMRAEPGRVQDFWNEAQALAREIDPARGFYRRSDLGTVYRKAKDLREGRTVTYNGREYPALYGPRNRTLIDVFAITADEERHLRTIISKAERERRRRERRRKAGVRPREEYEANSLSRIKPWEELGISRRWWYAKYRK